MKNIRFLILLFTTTLLFIGCESDDKKNDVIDNIVDDEFPVKRELYFTISGSLHTGKYSVLDRINPELTPGVIVLANPYENDLIRLSFKDSNQNLSFALSIPKEVGTFQYNNDTSQKITLYVNKDTDDELIFVSKNLT